VEDVALIVRGISFQDFQPMWSWSTNVTDGHWTDDMRSQDRALHYSASRGKKSTSEQLALKSLINSTSLLAHYSFCYMKSQFSARRISSNVQIIDNFCRYSDLYKSCRKRHSINLNASNKGKRSNPLMLLAHVLNWH